MSYCVIFIVKGIFFKFVDVVIPKLRSIVKYQNAIPIKCLRCVPCAELTRRLLEAPSGTKLISVNGLQEIDDKDEKGMIRKLAASMIAHLV